MLFSFISILVGCSGGEKEAAETTATPAATEAAATTTETVAPTTEAAADQPTVDAEAK